MRGADVRKGKTYKLVVAYSAVAIMFLIAPVLIVLPMSLTSTSFMTWPLPGYSTRWYENFFTDPAWTSALYNSIRVGIVATTVAVVLGVTAAFGVVRTNFVGKGALLGFLLSPIIMPTIIIATSLYFVVSRTGLIGNWLVLAATHAVLAMPAVIVIVGATVKGLDRSLEHASMSLGANRLQTFRLVVLPRIGPGIVSAGLIAFLISLDELLMALFIGGERSVTLPRRIWSGLRFQVNPTIAAVGSMLVLLAIAVAVVSGLLRRKSLVE